MAAGAALLAWALWAVTWGSLAEFVREVDIGARLFADYTARFHPVARDVLETRRPYPGYYYSPTFVLALIPLGRLPLPEAVRIWGAIQILVSIGLLLLPAIWLARRSRLLTGAYFLVFLTSMPILHSFNWGQVSALMTLLALASLLLAARGRPVVGAALLAAAVTIKFYPVLYLLPFVVRRDGKFLGAFAASWFVLGLVVPFAALGPADAVAFYREAAGNMDTDRAKITVDMNSQYLPHVIERWGYRLHGEARPLPEEGSALRTGLRLGAAALFLLGAGLAAARSRRDPDPIPAFALISISVPFLVPTAWPHYFTFLPFVQAWAAWELRSVTGPARWAGATLVLASVFFASLAGFRAAGDWWTFSHAGFPAIASAALIPVVWTLVARNRDPEPAR